MPRELVTLSADEFVIREIDVRPPGDGEVMVRSDFAAAKHGTEMAVVKGYGNRGRFDPELKVFLPESAGGNAAAPRPVGNMVVGTVIEVGSGVRTLVEGDRVVAHGPFRDVHVLGADRCRKVPDSVSWQTAVCLDPADFALAAVRDGNIRVGDAVAVFGLGAIGLMAVQVAKLSGAYPVIGVDPLANRREAGVVCGADSVLDPANCDAGLELKKATDRRGVDVAIEYSGAASAMQAALRGVAFGGTVVAGAFPPPYGAGLDFGAEAHLNRPNIVFSRAVSEPNRDHPRWSEDRIFDMCWRLFEQGMLTGEPVVTPVVDFEELVTEYPKIVSDPGSNIKLGCRFG